MARALMQRRNDHVHRAVPPRPDPPGSWFSLHRMPVEGLWLFEDASGGGQVNIGLSTVR